MPFRGFVSREAWNAYTSEWQAKRKAEGKCVRCGEPREGKYARWCDACGEKHRQERKKNRTLTTEYRRAMGLCVYCGKDLDTPRSKECCLKCLTKRMALPSQRRSHETRAKDREKHRKARAAQLEKNIEIAQRIADAVEASLSPKRSRGRRSPSSGG